MSAIAVVAYIVQNILHEGIGHGGACLLVGGDPVALSTAYFDCRLADGGGLASRIVAAAGAIVNVLTAGLFFLWLRRLPAEAHRTRLFAWLSMAIGLLTGTGYLLFSGVLGVGDWVEVIDGLEPIWIWRAVMALLGVLLYLWSIWFSLKEMNGFLGVDTARLKRAFTLTFFPYIVGSATSTIGAILNPISPLLILTSAASAFGGTSGLAWMSQMYDTKLFPAREGDPIEVARSWTWIVAAAVALLIHIFVLGPSFEW